MDLPFAAFSRQQGVASGALSPSSSCYDFLLIETRCRVAVRHPEGPFKE